MELNKEQLESINSNKKFIAVVAGPGSGKTSVLTKRIVRLVNESNISPFRIVAMTFTNKASKEMKHRVNKSLKIKTPKNITTIHKYCLYILRKYYGDKLGTICDDDSRNKIIKKILLDSKYKKELLPVLSAYISKCKSDMLNPEDFSSIFKKDFPKLYKEYNSKLFALKMFDLDDIILIANKLISKLTKEEKEKLYGKIEHLLVDEYQDTNIMQDIFINNLAYDYTNIFIVFDTDQCIYEWRSAYPINASNFIRNKEDVQVIKLEQNYRSVTSICKYASNVIKNNDNRIEKDIVPTTNTAGKIQVLKYPNNYTEADSVINIAKGYLQFGTVAILIRANHLSRSLEHSCIRAKVKYNVVSGYGFYDRAEIKDCLSLLKLSINNKDVTSFERLCKRFKIGIGDKKVDLIFNQVEEKNISIFDCNIDEITNKKLLLLKGYFDTLDIKNASKTLNSIMALLQYEDRLKSLSSNIAEFDDRLNNVREFSCYAQEYNYSVQELLDEVNLVNEQDEVDDKGNKLQIMTIHACKGLEFDTIIIPACEEGIIPNPRSDLEEERRLYYVACTRAKKNLFISFCQHRKMFNKDFTPQQSRFIKEGF